MNSRNKQVFRRPYSSASYLYTYVASLFPDHRRRTDRVISGSQLQAKYLSSQLQDGLVHQLYIVEDGEKRRRRRKRKKKKKKREPEQDDSQILLLLQAKKELAYTIGRYIYSYSYIRSYCRQERAQSSLEATVAASAGNGAAGNVVAAAAALHIVNFPFATIRGWLAHCMYRQTRGGNLPQKTQFRSSFSIGIPDYMQRVLFRTCVHRSSCYYIFTYIGALLQLNTCKKRALHAVCCSAAVHRNSSSYYV